MRLKNFSKLLILSLCALLTPLCAKADESYSLPAGKKIGFVKSKDYENHPQEKTAYTFFQELGFGADNVIVTTDIEKNNGNDLLYKMTPLNFDCVWIHIDRSDFNPENSLLTQTVNSNYHYLRLPSEYTNKKFLAVLRNYVAQGGDLLLTGYATELVDLMNRVPTVYAPNLIDLNISLNANNIVGVNPYQGINATYSDFGYISNDTYEGQTAYNPDKDESAPNKYDRRNHAIYSNLITYKQKSDGAGNPIQYWDAYALIQGSVNFTNNNCMWHLEAISGLEDGEHRINKFENDTRSCILGTWGQGDQGNTAGIVEFYPQINGEDNSLQGSILANGLAAYQFPADGNVNTYADNMKRLTSNMLAYLADKPANPGNNLKVTGWFTDRFAEEETLESTGHVAMYFDYEDATKFGEDIIGKEERNAYNWFVAKYGEDHVLFAGDYTKITKANYDCVWFHAMRSGMNAAIENPYNLTDEQKTEMKNVLKQYLSEGGNLFLSKHAALIAPSLGLGPNFSKCDTDQNTHVDNDPWYMNVKLSDDEDYSNHILFKTNQSDNDVYISGTILKYKDGSPMLYMTNAHDTNNNVVYENYKRKNANGDEETLAMNYFKNRLQFNLDYNCTIIGSWGHNTNSDGVGFIIYHPETKSSKATQLRKTSVDEILNRQGTVIVNGLAAYQFSLGDTNNQKEDLYTLTDNILKYLSPVADQKDPDLSQYEVDSYNFEHDDDNLGYVNGVHNYSEYEIDIEKKLNRSSVKSIEVNINDPEHGFDTEWVENHTWDDAVHGKDEASHELYHGMWIGEPYASVTEDGNIVLYANVAGKYKVVVTTKLGTVYTFKATVWPTLNDNNIYFTDMDTENSAGGTIKFGNLKPEERSSIQLYTHHWGTLYYKIIPSGGGDAAKRKFVVATSVNPATDSDFEEMTATSTPRFDLRNASGMSFVQKVNGLNSNVKTVTFDGTTTSVEAIEAAEAENAQYFTLEGIKVEAPTLPGIYVKVQNGKAVKFVVK